MSKQQLKPAATEQGSDGSAIPTVVVHPLVIRLLKENKTRSILTLENAFKELPPQVKAIGDDEEESILLNTVSMDHVGGGYCPDGYPDGLKSYGRQLRLRVYAANETASKSVAKEPTKEEAE